VRNLENFGNRVSTEKKNQSVELKEKGSSEEKKNLPVITDTAKKIEKSRKTNVLLT